uniref:Bifunctional deaminase-reductase domain protein n=1 Tax=Cyanothece sp. (strain PCC 7425 / ATCC 29141) TaxID=395961 RepID=B8HL50_CYAP4
MVEIIYYVATSVDGYIATPEGGVEWLSPFESKDEDYGYAEFYASVDGLLLGRRTYEQALGFGEWPYAGKPCWVCSKQQLQPTQLQVNVTDKAPGAIVTELAQLGLRRVWLVGGGELAGAFQRQGLLDEYIISVIPVVLGAGISLFGPSSSMLSLKLTSCQSFPRGVVQLHYRRDASA